MSELKPCPFCGGEAEAVHEIDGFWTVECVKCGALVDGIEAWNTRAGCKDCAALNRAAGLWAKADKRVRELERTCKNMATVQRKFACSECGDVWGKPSVDEFKFCPTCGAKVVEE